MPFTLATWNINSVRLREPIVLKLLAEHGPDVLCLQECKSPVDKIPTAAFIEAGYTHMVARGQDTMVWQSCRACPWWMPVIKILRRWATRAMLRQSSKTG